jgi:hypothetical protein
VQKAKQRQQNNQFSDKYRMLLLEFLYFNDNNNDFAVDRRYENNKDSSVLKRSDTRKTRLTLRQINRLRMQAEAHDYERDSELEFVRQMYGAPAGEAEQPAA